MAYVYVLIVYFDEVCLFINLICAENHRIYLAKLASDIYFWSWSLCFVSIVSTNVIIGRILVQFEQNLNRKLHAFSQIIPNTRLHKRKSHFWSNRRLPLRKQAYSNILNILTTKKWKFSDKNLNISHTSDQNIDCGYSLEPPRRGGSNKYPQSMFLGRNKKNNVYPCKPQFYYIKVGFKGVNII